MNLFLAYQIALGVGLAIVGAWAVDARRLIQRAFRLLEMRYDPPTEEIPLPTTRIAPRADYPGRSEMENARIYSFEEFGPGKPVPRWDFERLDRAAGQEPRWGDDAP